MDDHLALLADWFHNPKNLPHGTIIQAKLARNVNSCALFVINKVAWYALRKVVVAEDRTLSMTRVGGFYTLGQAEARLRELTDNHEMLDLHQMSAVYENLSAEAIQDPAAHCQPGDHIAVLRGGKIGRWFGIKGLYFHHGIYVGDGEICHLHSDANSALDFKRTSHATITKWDVFVDGCEHLFVVKWTGGPVRDAERIVELARRAAASKARYASYSVAQANCEHFACHCVTGYNISLQFGQFHPSQGRGADHPVDGPADEVEEGSSKWDTAVEVAKMVATVLLLPFLFVGFLIAVGVDLIHIQVTGKPLWLIIPIKTTGAVRDWE